MAAGSEPEVFGAECRGLQATGGIPQKDSSSRRETIGKYVSAGLRSEKIAFDSIRETVCRGQPQEVSDKFERKWLANVGQTNNSGLVK